MHKHKGKSQHAAAVYFSFAYAPEYTECTAQFHPCLHPPLALLEAIFLALVKEICLGCSDIHNLGTTVTLQKQNNAVRCAQRGTRG